MTVYIVMRQSIANAFVWAAFSTNEKAHEFIEKMEDERGFDGFYISELAVDAD